jgi:hypothetical protein
LVEPDERPLLGAPSSAPDTPMPDVDTPPSSGPTMAAPPEAPIPATPGAIETRLVRPFVAQDRAVPAPSPSVRPGSRRPSLSTGPDAEAERIVHVTIGRVEVKAASPAPSAAPAEPTPSPAVSLDDYLRRASGGSA